MRRIDPRVTPPFNDVKKLKQPEIFRLERLDFRLAGEDATPESAPANAAEAAGGRAGGGVRIGWAIKAAKFPRPVTQDSVE